MASKRTEYEVRFGETTIKDGKIMSQSGETMYLSEKDYTVLILKARELLGWKED